MAGSLEAKIVVLGSQGVGKTSLVHRYVKNQFSPASTTSTVGASFLTKRVVDDDSDTTVRLQIWDTAGQERFRSISRLYYRGANACILCYSITDITSFEEMGIWLTELRRNLPPEIILHVVGTKADIVAQNPAVRQVPFERCIAYVADNLAPGQSSTPPPTATPLGFERQQSSSLSASAAAGSGGGYMSTGFDGARSPSSKRSSGFWGQDVGWDCCHEVSAESGEGVEEVFRVITRKLVEQNRKMTEAITSATGTPGLTPGLREQDGYFDGVNPRGSFRVGRDRRSWLGFPPGVFVDAPQDGDAENGQAGNGIVHGGKKRRGRCC